MSNKRSLEVIADAWDHGGTDNVTTWELQRLTRWRRRARDPKVIARDQARRNRLLAYELAKEES